jgi:hypothetical protein
MQRVARRQFVTSASTAKYFKLKEISQGAEAFESLIPFKSDLLCAAR